MIEPPTPARNAHPVHPPWPTRWVLLAGGIHLLSATWHVFYGGQNIDEGFYALAARSVWQGDVPYRDFGYTQMPLLPYLNGLAMQITGFGLFEQRAINALWTALTLLLAVRWLGRRTSPAWALGFAGLLSLSAPWMYFAQLGKTYAFTGLMVMAAWWVFTERTPGRRKIVLLALLGTVGTGCRLPAAPFFAVLWLAAVVEPGQPGRQRWWAVLLSLGWPVCLLLPFYLVACEAARFWTVDFHRISVAAKAWPHSWLNVFTLAPGLWLGLAAGLVYAAVKRPRFGRTDAAVFAATLLALAANLLPPGAYQEYGVPFLPPLMLVVALLIWRAGATRGRLAQFAWPAGVLFLNLGTAAALLWRTMPAERHTSLSALLPLDAPDYNPALPAQLAQARQVVRDFLPPDQPFIGPHLILAVETGRAVPRPLRMGAFTATADFSADQARRLNLATFPSLDAYFHDPAVPLIALTKNASLNYAWSMPSFRKPPERRGPSWLELFRRDFLVAYEDEEFFILVRKPAAPGASR